MVVIAVAVLVVVTIAVVVGVMVDAAVIVHVDKELYGGLAYVVCTVVCCNMGAATVGGTVIVNA